MFVNSKLPIYTVASIVCSITFLWSPRLSQRRHVCCCDYAQLTYVSSNIKYFKLFASMKFICISLYVISLSVFHRLHLLYSHKLRALFFNLSNLAVYVCLCQSDFLNVISIAVLSFGNSFRMIILRCYYGNYYGCVYRSLNKYTCFRKQRLTDRFFEIWWSKSNYKFHRTYCFLIKRHIEKKCNNLKFILILNDTIFNAMRIIFNRQYKT
jgi:hypothetical protein